MRSMPYTHRIILSSLPWQVDCGILQYAVPSGPQILGFLEVTRHDLPLLLA